ncbi:bifunctional demethylmenaquinone methyltransferase/2-methoxy-6-polyprenyl-1,4-benzoquinol methylase UbiE [Aliifodinibius sp. S!AR15-10]|uniref:bifunctional demethylmenaquinone methyltransferase/2-methoxy-6-polyprenyl-1,4-benzoquinol methylase UbiE n=1 Tax=Aliifodinibius sp. S!AR15-10 TaxID=2950437 RepID=UPI00285913F5|nr:bifunctional demethylmenaquinone methyltransferase/2-methoxy-6-polyprenyl-1,4-benzoquinol methylase UbiE [Aliifodinibius sp. S!AR15-10]MDR8391758.1 bifunctional demethylmenaquinone methyltransferase/2-methoxy-6-polyprenyl-1,4-benzoquinol methylase UbiE [Aliifodinibius sp. S!AR15-10]
MSEKVRRMFADIADDYDRINSILSFGVHHAWRTETVRLSGADLGDKVLDCATGTGDLAIEFKRKVGNDGYVLGTDFCKEMIEYAPDKAKNENLEVDFEVADAMNLPYEEDRFDICSIAFGIRNVDEPVTALKEMARVVRPGGKIVVLEFGQPKGLMKFPYELYSQYIMPAVGGWISGNREAYTYLPKTSAKFPAGEHFLALMDEAGSFAERTSNKLTAGIAYIYVGTVQ